MQNKRIYNKLKIPICKFCQQKNTPCIRCGRDEYSNGKITEFGPVCNSCAKYFIEKKKCSQCYQYSVNVAQRTLMSGDRKLLCQKCYEKTLPVCSRCSYRRKPYCYTLDKKPICHICATEGVRACKLCGNSFAAGKGNICSDCHYQKSLSNKTAFIANSLSNDMQKIFTEFSNWLSKRRGLCFASTHLQKYQKYFFDINILHEKLNRMPSYEEIVVQYSVATTRKYLLVTLFLSEKRLIAVDKKVQEEYANIDMINKYVASFKNGSFAKKALDAYYTKLQTKLKKNQTTARSVRLALTPAVKFLDYCKNFQDIKPNIVMLNAYLWHYPGQKASITGFINFLQKSFKLNLSVKNITKPILERPKTSKQQLKQRFINMLRQKKSIDNKSLLKVAIAYLHGVDIPENIFIKTEDIKKDKHENYFIHFAGESFYLPLEIATKIKDAKKQPPIATFKEHSLNS